jgi:hypothetical protein
MNDVAMFWATLGAMVALVGSTSGGLYLLIRTEMRAGFALLDQRLTVVENDLHPIRDYFLERGLVASVGAAAEASATAAQPATP